MSENGKIYYGTAIESGEFTNKYKQQNEKLVQRLQLIVSNYNFEILSKEDIVKAQALLTEITNG